MTARTLRQDLVFEHALSLGARFKPGVAGYDEMRDMIWVRIANPSGADRHHVGSVNKIISFPAEERFFYLYDDTSD